MYIETSNANNVIIVEVASVFEVNGEYIHKPMPTNNHYYEKIVPLYHGKENQTFCIVNLPLPTNYASTKV